MVLRSVVGALAAVGVLGAIAAALPARTTSKSTDAEPQFGTIAKSQPTARQPDPTPDQDAQLRRQALLKLASATREQGDLGGPPPSPTARADGPAQVLAYAPALTPSPLLPAVVRPGAVAARTVPEAPPPIQAASSSPPGAPPARPQQDPAVPAPTPTKLALASPGPADATARTNGLVNINRASTDALDHIPGGGRIGLSIVRRRPYASVDDLVRKRVLRRSAFERIRPAITVD